MRNSFRRLETLSEARRADVMWYRPHRVKRFSADTKVTDLLYACYDKAEAGEDFSDILTENQKAAFMKSLKD